MSGWWAGLSGFNQTLYGIAVLVSVPFLWQLVMALVGLGMDGSDIDFGGDDGDLGHVDSGDATATVFAFKLLSVRAIVTFFTLFFWASALYLEQGHSLMRTFTIAAVWGLVGMSLVGLLLHLLPKLAYSGTRDLDTAIGSEATVYVDIPDGGTGEIRAIVGSRVSYVKARAVDGKAIVAGTVVAVRQRVGQTLLIVEAI